MSYQNSHSCIPFIPDTYHDRTGCCFRYRPCLPYVIIIILCCHGERNSWCLNNSTIEGVRVRVGPTLNIQLLPVSLQILSPYRTNRQRVVNWGLAHSGSDPFNYSATVIQLNYKTTQFPDKYHNFLINTTCIKLSWDIPPVGTQCPSSEAYQYLPFPYQLGTHFDCLYKRACINDARVQNPLCAHTRAQFIPRKALLESFLHFGAGWHSLMKSTWKCITLATVGSKRNDTSTHRPTAITRRRGLTRPSSLIWAFSSVPLVSRLYKFHCIIMQSNNHFLASWELRTIARKS